LPGGPIKNLCALSNEDAHREYRVCFNDNPFNDFGSSADEAIIFDDGWIGLQGFKHTTNANAPGQMNMLPDLGTRPDRCPRVDHGAFIDISTNVDKRRHQDHIFGNETPAASHGRGHDSKATLSKSRRIVVHKLE